LFSGMAIPQRGQKNWVVSPPKRLKVRAPGEPGGPPRPEPPNPHNQIGPPTSLDVAKARTPVMASWGGRKDPGLPGELDDPNGILVRF